MIIPSWNIYIAVTTRLDNAATSTRGGYATTTNTRPCLWLNSVLWEFSLWDKDTVSSIQFDCENIPKSQTLSVPEINFSSRVKLASKSLYLTENRQWNDLTRSLYIYILSHMVLSFTGAHSGAQIQVNVDNICGLLPIYNDWQLYSWDLSNKWKQSQELNFRHY